MKHSADAINVLIFETKNGVVKSIGSDQSDKNNEFNWKVTVVELNGEYERLQGAYAHVQNIRGEIVLSTVGFFTNDCHFVKERPVPKPAVTPPPDNNDSNKISSPTKKDGLKHLTDHGFWDKSQ